MHEVEKLKKQFQRWKEFKNIFSRTIKLSGPIIFSSMNYVSITKALQMIIILIQMLLRDSGFSDHRVAFQ